MSRELSPELIFLKNQVREVQEALPRVEGEKLRNLKFQLRICEEEFRRRTIDVPSDEADSLYKEVFGSAVSSTSSVQDRLVDFQVKVIDSAGRAKKFLSGNPATWDIKRLAEEFAALETEFQPLVAHLDPEEALNLYHRIFEIYRKPLQHAVAAANEAATNLNIPERLDRAAIPHKSLLAILFDRIAEIQGEIRQRLSL